MVNNKHLVKIDKDLINFLRLSYRCPGCMKQVILAPDISDKEYLTCGVCQHSIHIRSNQAHFLKELIYEFDRDRKILEMNGLQVWIEGQPDTSPLLPGSTTLKYTQYRSPLK
jgi:DNA-directed RNA polymerase subunit RPC12/RpoP